MRPHTTGANGPLFTAIFGCLPATLVKIMAGISSPGTHLIGDICMSGFPLTFFDGTSSGVGAIRDDRDMAPSAVMAAFISMDTLDKGRGEP